MPSSTSPHGEGIEVLVSVMAYPAISSQMGEVVCVAGFRVDNLWQSDWVRLFPFHVRHMPSEVRVHKWDIVRLRARPTPKDTRPESFAPDMDSIEIVGHMDTKNNWRDRKIAVDPHRGKTMLELEADQAVRNASLGVVEPGEILDVEVTPRSPKELEEAKRRAEAETLQGDLFSLEDRLPLEPLPFDFHVRFRCTDEIEPRRLKIIDWEINQAFRNYRNLYDDPEERVRDRWLNTVCGPKTDPAFFVGNQKRFPEQWLLLGIFWPGRT
jgi:hypothetical protein